jgi:hypothetical protein
MVVRLLSATSNMAGRMKMDKAAVICRLHEITDHYLLGSGTWPANREFLPAFFKTVRELGLDEDVPDSPRTTRYTALGKELKLDLLMAFVGAWISGRFLTFLKRTDISKNPKRRRFALVR